VKGVREKKTRRDKERTFHRVSPSITSTLAFILCTTLFPIIRSKRNEKYKRGRSKTTNLNCPKEKNYPKNYTPEHSSPELWKSRGIYRQKWAPGRVYEAARQISTRGSMVRPRNAAKATFSRLYWLRARGAFCHALSVCTLIGCMSWILDMGTRFR